MSGRVRSGRVESGLVRVVEFGLYSLILTYLLSYTVSKLWLIIGQVFASESGVTYFNALAGVTPCQYRHK